MVDSVLGNFMDQNLDFSMLNLNKTLCIRQRLKQTPRAILFLPHNSPNASPKVIANPSIVKILAKLTNLAKAE